MNNILAVKRGMTALLAIIVGFTLSFGAFMATPQTAYAATKTPTKITTVNISKRATTSFKVSYSKASKAKKYQIAYKKTSANKWSYKATKSRSATLKGLSNNTIYLVKVRGVNGKKYGKWSKTKTATTTAKTPAKVNSLKKASVSTTSIKIKWNKSSNANKYQIAYKKASASKWSHKTVSSPSATLSGLSNNTKYQVKVRGVNARATTKYGSYSSTLTATTHTHNWVAMTQTVHHDAVYKTVVVSYYHCKECGADFDDLSSISAHCEASMLQGGNPSYTTLQKSTQQLVTAAYDETVTTGYKCSICGATK